MLQKLLIQNYAIIESVEIEFSEKLNIITGETGAGKSILVGALGLILGERADSTVLFNETKKCIVEGCFWIEDRKDVRILLQENDLDGGGELIIRREVSSAGKSRAFINDTPVTLSQLKQLTSLLVDMHQQFDTLELGDSDFQREVMDALAAHKGLLNNYRDVFTRYSQVQKELRLKKEQQAAADKELDYHKFLYEELEEAQWQENELEALDAELKILSNAEEIKTILDKISYELNVGEQPLVQQLKSLNNQLHAIENFHAGIPALGQRLQSAQIELKDIAEEMDMVNQGIKLDEERIQVVNDRLALGYKLLKKHGVQTTGELLDIRNSLQQQLNRVLDLGNEISGLEKEAETYLTEAKELADSITAGRKKQAPPLEKKTRKLLAQVGMPNASLKIQISPSDLHITGGDRVEFLFDANKSGRYESLRKVASGGELSRLMLCIKSLVAASVQLPTLIFDEIDSGISGEAARQVGIIMKELGQSHQVIAITHQPQIAAKAYAHYFVFKSEKDGKVSTHIRRLSEPERIDAVAQMLSGEKPTASALENAKEMLEG